MSLPQPKNPAVELYPQEGERQVEPWEDYQCLHFPVANLDAWNHAWDTIAFMAAEVRLNRAMPLEERFRVQDQLQEMMRRPELLDGILAEAGLTAVKGHMLAFFDPRQFATSSAPPPKAA
jgi:hypothetical protein